MVKLSSRKGQTEIIIAVLVALGILILAGTTAGPKKSSVEAPSPSTASGTEEKGRVPHQITKGMATFYISSAAAGPEVYEATLSPLGGAAPGLPQVISVKVRHEAPVNSVNVTMIMDSSSYLVPLNLVNGTATDGVWNGSWEVLDTHDVIYQAAIEARSAVDSFRMVLTFQPLP